MLNPQTTYTQVIKLLDDSQAEYKLFEHKAALSWEELEAVQKECGFVGQEMKCMVMKTDLDFIVYVTLQGNRLDFSTVKEKTGAKKVRLATAEELKEDFAAEPGCAYPFGFDKAIQIYVDPAIYEREWLLFSPVLPTRTVQITGESMRTVFSEVENEVVEVSNFNKP